MEPTIGDQLKDRRKKLGISQSALAYLARVTRGTIRNLETDAVDTDERTLRSVSLVLGVNPRAVIQDHSAREVVNSSVASGILELILAGGNQQQRYPRDSGRVLKEITAYTFIVDQLAAKGYITSKNFAAVEDLAGVLYPRFYGSNEDEEIMRWFSDLGLSSPEALVARRLPVSREALMDAARERRAKQANMELEAVLPGRRKEVFSAPEEADFLEVFRAMKESLSDAQRHLDVIESFKLRKDGFDNLPIKVQRILGEGRVLDFQNVEIPGGSVLTLILRVDDGSIDASFGEAAEFWENEHAASIERWHKFLEENEEVRYGSTE